MSKNNDLQERLLEASDENNRQIKRIADSLDELLGMIKGVQPKDLAKKAREHKKAQANLKKEVKKNVKIVGLHQQFQYRSNKVTQFEAPSFYLQIYNCGMYTNISSNP